MGNGPTIWFSEGAGAGGWVFSSRFYFLFSSDRKPENIFPQSESQNIFSGQSKNNFFPKQLICSKCIVLDLYVRVFLEPSIHGYIAYMFVYILDFGSECMYMFKLFSNFSYRGNL